MKRIISLTLVLLLLLPFAVSCGDDSSATLISFSEAASVEYLKTLDGKKVSIIGYMSSLSPVSGSFMYLMNMPYQSCPFCVPNTTQLSNTMAVYAKKNSSFKYTDKAISVTGTLKFGNYVDDFGYVYNYRIENATYSEVDTSNMSDTLRLWQSFASTGVLQDIQAMYDYVYFVCFWWSDSYITTFKDGSGNTFKDYWNPDIALRYIKNVEYKDGGFSDMYISEYFDGLVSRIEAVDKEAFSDLVQNIREAEALANSALSELENGGYKEVYEYSDYFKENHTMYKHIDENKQIEINNEWNTVWGNFSLWLAKWEV